MNIQNLRTVAQFSDENPAITQSALRWQIFNAKENGLEASGAIVRNGRRIYIETELYTKWLASQSQVA